MRPANFAPKASRIELGGKSVALEAMEEMEEEQLMDGEDGGVETSEGVSLTARPPWSTRCLALVALLVALPAAALCLSSTRPWHARTDTTQPLSLYSSAECLACGQSDALHCGRQLSGHHVQEDDKRANRSQAQEEPEAFRSFSCNDGCMIWMGNVNDDVCHCPHCEDEEMWSCETCGSELRGLGGYDDEYPLMHHHYARDVGLGVGIGLSSAFALGFGLAFGLDSQTYYVVVVNLVLDVFNSIPFRSSRVLQRAIRTAVARLSGVTLSEVALRFPALASGGRRLLRKLKEAVNVDVGIRFVDSARATEVNQQLLRETGPSVQRVVTEEVEKAGASGQVEVVRWTPAPNPLSYNPNKGPVDSGFHFDDGVSLG